MPQDEGQPKTNQRRERLQRVMADAGVAARRVCEEMIAKGHVRVNGKTVTRLPVFVDPENDQIEVDSRPLPKAQRHVYVMLNKPEGVLVTVTDEEGLGRTTVSDLVQHPSGVRLYPVGRLDWDTRGLVLMTNDGDLANRLTHPRYEVEKTYEAVVRGGVEPAAADSIAQKLRLASQHQDVEQGRVTKAKRSSGARVRVVRSDSERTLLEITLKEARNQLLRDVLKQLGMPVKKLTRIRIGPLALRELAHGSWRELTREEVQALRTMRPGASGATAKPKKKMWRPGQGRVGPGRPGQGRQGQGGQSRRRGSDRRGSPPRNRRA